jgi:hypothetical protein
VPNERHSILDVQRAIRRHCARHPSAADTVDGVHQWWLGDLVCTRDDVEDALRAMVALGELGERRLSDGRILYVGRKD